VAELFEGADVVFHLAANPDVRAPPRAHFEDGVAATFNVLEACRARGAPLLVFASSSTVYGEAKKIPTPEDYWPLEPISFYGAAKLACEALALSYAKAYGLRVLVLRYANVVGPRSRRGVVVDFVKKLRENPRRLEVLGDGSQKKSYVHVLDAVDATLKALEIVKAPPVPSYGVLRVWKEGRELGLAAYAMELIDILNPEGGKAVVRISGNLEEVKEGDLLRIGPAPYTRLFVEGVIASVDRASGQLVLKVRRLVSIPREPVSEIASKELVAVKPEDSLKEVAELLVKKKIRGAPVLEDKKVVGIITMTDIARAFVDGKLDAKVRAYMRKNVVTIREDEDILEAVKLMDLYGVGRLIVVDAVGKPVGIVTRTDVLRRIAAMSTS